MSQISTAVDNCLFVCRPNACLKRLPPSLTCFVCLYVCLPEYVYLCLTFCSWITLKSLQIILQDLRMCAYQLIVLQNISFDERIVIAAKTDKGQDEIHGASFQASRLRHNGQTDNGQSGKNWFLDITRQSQSFPCRVVAITGQSHYKPQTSFEGKIIFHPSSKWKIF